MSQQITPPPTDIDRRSVLKTGAALGVFSVSGCIGDLGEDDPTGEDPTSDDEGPTPDGENGESVDAVIEEVATGLANPWAMAFIPDSSSMLVTELGGTLNLVDREEGSVEEIDGTPEVYAEGQGGLLDVALHPEFPDESWVYLTYSVVNDDGESATAIGRGQLEDTQLTAFEELFVAEPFIDSNGHFGSRALFDEGALYMTTGDRQQKDFGPDHVAQDTTNELGATLRLAPDGSIPEDNPFVDDPDVADAIYSYGHRNVQAMTVHPETGEIWQGEHGEEDGDEINIVEEGENFGWPIATYGCEYGTDTPVGDQPDEREETVAPVYYWECGSGGFPPSGMTFYDGEAFPDWQGDLFMGNLAGGYLGRFSVDGREVEEIDPLLSDQGWRVRDVKVAPDTGHLYVVVDEGDAPLVRLVPE
ncbi:MAG: PQQ-dependent sugar dehydrogenase [Euryarchaeota archaeon]|jgi:glucose/arabinose dehydrogenase|nr:PQQ-dependent sugar dehydrogenase [Euryarchaeota archaeon]